MSNRPLQPLIYSFYKFNIKRQGVRHMRIKISHTCVHNIELFIFSIKCIAVIIRCLPNNYNVTYKIALL
jgi:hypothetical protein